MGSFLNRITWTAILGIPYGHNPNLLAFYRKPQKYFDNRNASITIEGMGVNLDQKYFMNRKDEEDESTGAK